jgi:hypothetical protein
MEGIEYKFSDGGELVFLQVLRSLLCFTRAESVRPLKRGKSVIRNDRGQDREEARIVRWTRKWAFRDSNRCPI